MSNSLLLPNRFKDIGWLVLIPSAVLGLVLAFNDFESDWLWANVFTLANDGRNGNYVYLQVSYVNITNTVIGACFIAGALLVSFSKEKREDEFIAELRLSSLLWAVWASHILLFLAFLFVYGTPFLNVMVYNMFTVLIIFMVRFNYILYKNSKMAPDEK